MGHYCRICHRYRPNERFSGGGHRNHICKDCHRLPGQTRFRVEALDEIGGFLEQSNISPKNLKRLAILAQSDDIKVREMAALVFAIGKAHPGRKKRYRSIKANQPELWQKMLQKGLVEDDGDSWISEEYSDPMKIEDMDEYTDLMEYFEDDELPF